MKKRRFVWKAVDEKGILQHGSLLSEEIPKVQAVLREKGYFPVAICATRDWPFFPLKTYPKLKWSHFARRLATVLEAGIPLLQALEIMTAQEGKLTFEQKQWKKIKEHVENGNDLSEALARLHSSPNMFILSMIKAGEYTGTLGKALNEVADELDLEFAYRQRIKSALAYPLLLFLALIVVLYIFSVWVLPMYENFFAGLKIDLPLMTKVIFVGGRLIPLFLWSALGLSLGGLVALKHGLSKRCRIGLEHLLTTVPFWGKIYRLRDLFQFSRVLARLIKAGIPLLESLSLTASTLRSREMQELTDRLILNVSQGKRLAPLLRASKIFPREGAEMILVAEESGQLDNMLLYVAQMFHRELEDRLNHLTAMLGPVLILILAGLIGVVAGGVMLPIFDLSAHLE